MAASKDMAKLYDGADLSADTPDQVGGEARRRPRLLPKKSGFPTLAEYEEASMNITVIMYGTDPQTKKFTETSEQIKKEIAALKGAQSVPEAEKRDGFAHLEAALKDAKPVQFKERHVTELS